MKYAGKTQVSSDKSKAEIERTLQRYGATGFMYGWQDSIAVIMFQMNALTLIVEPIFFRLVLRYLQL